MKTISFYSYKGGVGRTLALAYTAKYLADSNLGVCVLDIDLEAPGIINKFFTKEEELRSVTSKLGIVDYVNSFKEGKIPDNLEEYFSTVPEYPKNKYGYIKIMGAGKGIETNEYWNNLSKIDWNKMFSDEDGEGLYYIFEILKRQIKEQINPDYLLIDSRSGVTKMGLICTSVLPDKVVMLSANNSENRYGSKRMYHHIKNSTNFKVDNSESDIICAITRFPRDDDKTIEYKQLRKFYSDIDKRDEADIINDFLKIVDHPKLEKSDIFTIHSNRDVERNELSILQNKQFADRETLEQEYSKIINKLIEADRELLEKRKTLNKNQPKYSFIQFDLLGIIEDELEKLQNEMSDTDISNPYCLLYKCALSERKEKNISDAVMSLFSLIEDPDADVKWKTHAHYLRGIIFLYDLYNYEKSIEDLTLVYNTDTECNYSGHLPHPTITN
ncbi:hypothetical protein FACS189415_4780 [Bacteroidia bacterium]|nr:hypothetical protein FACS189426_07810 [Bacteroidia bacterium]GHU83114.1 hypothetical protein FACS189415_4780 [Bacteroidia bacterium]